MQSSNQPVVLMLKPDSILIQEIKVSDICWLVDGLILQLYGD